MKQPPYPTDDARWAALVARAVDAAGPVSYAGKSPGGFCPAW